MKEDTYDLPRATPWLERTLHAECPWCGFCHLVDSDHSLELPERETRLECDRCEKAFIVEGTSSKRET